MLETEEVDDDFFTPVAGTSLAFIFGSASKSEDKTENDSLKYVPPKPQNIAPIKKEQIKTTECVFASALVAHEWCDNVYTSRGKLGFAIIKIHKTGEHNIILYDSNKTTLSSANISTRLEVTIKKNCYISYYDSSKKYWSLYGTQEEAKKIAELLTSLGANVNYAPYSDKGYTQPINAATESLNFSSTTQYEQQNKESDTDSATNKKTKASLLTRMANLGHSLLPSKHVPAEVSSDSSDVNDTDTQLKSVRHKPRNNSKKNQYDHSLSELQHQRIIATKMDTDNNVALYNQQFMPLVSQEMNMFMLEQRVNNCELRMSLNRINDKVESVLQQIDNFEQQNPNAVMTKLLDEYENKVKLYLDSMEQDRLEGKEIDSAPSTPSKDDDIEVLKRKISEIKQDNEDKVNEITNLHDEMQLLKDKHAQDLEIQAGREKEMLSAIKRLEDELKMKSDELTDMKDNMSANTSNNEDIGEKVKNIMNETFQTISINFDNNDQYTGETIKKIIGTVIKKITIQTLNGLK
ncbi:uncharacterized protein LOC142983141 [Anticarsia gemmatalis]|uniref:uncharacterized protein LOC142983141 n=1 Tax=Anticarsia gemmatalis TaxID=129554 RepID=UPI003F770BD6